MNNIQYGCSEDAWLNVVNFIETLIKRHDIKSILEVGAGANPAFPIEFVNENKLEYTILDISNNELEKAPSGYNTILADISDQNFKVEGQYDFIFSRMLAEHIKNGEQFHKNIFNLTIPGGVVFHFFPTLYALPFVINKLLPETITIFILNKLQSGRQKEGRHAKFPAYYDKCKGPIKSQFNFFNKLGYEVNEYHGFFGHSSYYQKLKPLCAIHNKISNWLIKKPNPWITSFAYVILKKPIN